MEKLVSKIGVDEVISKYDVINDMQPNLRLHRTAQLAAKNHAPSLASLASAAA